MVGTSVGVDGVAVASAVPDTVAMGVTLGISPGASVLVGARVGMGAWVGVATSVLPGSASVTAGWGVGEAAVVWVGKEMITVGPAGLIAMRGRTK